jgi:hypothetical protein
MPPKAPTCPVCGIDPERAKARRDGIGKELVALTDGLTSAARWSFVCASLRIFIELVFIMARAPVELRSPVPLLFAGIILLRMRAVAEARPLLASSVGVFAVVVAGIAPFVLDGMRSPTPAAYMAIAGVCSIRALIAGWRLERLKAPTAVPSARVVSTRR